jgi:hypothetical protein
VFRIFTDSTLTVAVEVTCCASTRHMPVSSIGRVIVFTWVSSVNQDKQWYGNLFRPQPHFSKSLTSSSYRNHPNMQSYAVLCYIQRLYSAFNVTDQVLHPHRTDKITVHTHVALLVIINKPVNYFSSIYFKKVWVKKWSRLSFLFVCLFVCFLVSTLPPTHGTRRGLLLQLITMTHAHNAGLLWMRDRPVAET